MRLVPVLSGFSLVGALSLVVLPGVLPALDIGDKAPALSQVTWLQGDPPASGIPVVVEFWATWCGPCKASIPHLNGLAKRYAGKVAFAGLSDEDRPTVAPFIVSAKMEYTVGLLGDPARTAWMEQEPGIPTAFLVGTDGIVVWKGSPMALDPVLEQVVAGTWDATAAVKVVALQKRLQEDLSSADIEVAASVAKVRATAKELLALSPADEEALGTLIGIAQHQGDASAARAVWDGLDIAKLSPGQAANLARMASEQPEFEFRNLEAARALALHAVAGGPTDVVYLETLARIEYACGRIEDAIAAQEKALHAAKGTPEDPREQAILEYYISVLQLRSGKPVTRPAAAKVDAPSPAKPAPALPESTPILP